MSMKGHTHSAETRAKMRTTHNTPEVQAKHIAAAKGKHPSLETRAKISAALIGIQPSPETRAKMSNAKIGNKIWFGKTHSPESRAKMSRPKSPETRAKMSAAKKGKHPSLETRVKMSVSHKTSLKAIAYHTSLQGDKNPMRRPEVRAKLRAYYQTPEGRAAAVRRGVANKGRHPSSETLAKMSTNNAMRRPEIRAKMRTAQQHPDVRAKMRDNHVGMAGKTHSTEFRAMMSAAVSAARARGSYGRHPNGNERRLYAYLHFLALEFKPTPTVRVLNYNVDALVEPNLIFEADGDYWHSLEGCKKRDDQRDANLRSDGYVVIHYSETYLRYVEKALVSIEEGRKALIWAEKLKGNRSP